MKIKKVAETICLDNFIIKDFENNNLYTGDIVLITSGYTSEFAIVEYAKYNNKNCIIFHSPLLPYGFLASLLDPQEFKSKKHRLFKKNYSINFLEKDMNAINFAKLKKQYRGVIYRKQWNILPNFISANLATCKSNHEHYKDYNKYNLYALLENKGHYEFLFRGDNIEIPF